MAMSTHHMLVAGRVVCPRHKGGMTYVGKHCLCSRWACSCGAALGLRTDYATTSDLDVAWEKHVLDEGGTLPEISELRERLGDLRSEEYHRHMEFERADERLCAQIARAQARSVLSGAEAKRYTIEQAAANAAMVAPMLGKDADEEHERVYSMNWSLAEKHGLLEIAQTDGLTSESWSTLWMVEN